MSKKLKIAIQKSGRLQDDSVNLLRECGLKINNGKDQLRVESSNFPLEILYLRNSDIPQYLKDGVADIAIVGENLLHEKAPDLPVIEKLGFSKCRVSIAVPKSRDFASVNDLNGKKIATSYPETLKKYLAKNEISAETHLINGSVEIAPNIGLADAICDIVSSGSTLFKNNLKEVDTILKSEAVLVSGKDIQPQKKEVLNKLIFRIRSVLQAKDYRYLLLNAPDEKISDISAILPGMKSPTVMPLAEKGWSSLHTVINQERFWEVIEELKQNGAEGILICPIEKMVN